jgi:hypothetical protein
MNHSLDPQVGDRVTYCIGSDSYAQTVSERISKVRLKTRRDKTHQIGDYYGDQRWIAVSDPAGRESEYTRRPDGTWRPKGSLTGFLIAGSHEHQDPSF